MMDNFCLFCVLRGERNFSEPGSGAKRKGNDTKVRACFFGFFFTVSVRLLVGLVWPISEEGVAVHSNTPIEPPKKAYPSNRNFLVGGVEWNLLRNAC